jgi:hypothetical protein
LSPFEAVRKTRRSDTGSAKANATSTVAFAWDAAKNQCWPLVGLSALGGVMNDPTGATTCFGFLGFFTSLFPRTWPLAMGILLATTS